MYNVLISQSPTNEHKIDVKYVFDFACRYHNEALYALLWRVSGVNTWKIFSTYHSILIDYRMDVYRAVQMGHLIMIRTVSLLSNLFKLKL